MELLLIKTSPIELPKKLIQVSSGMDTSNREILREINNSLLLTGNPCKNFQENLSPEEAIEGTSEYNLIN